MIKKSEKESNLVKGNVGINYVQSMVEESWRSGWQVYDAKNDDAIDGIILMRRGRVSPKDTGGVVFTQVKCGAGYRNDLKSLPDFVAINLGKEYIDTHKPRWLITQGPCVLIYIDDTEQYKKKAWWVNLKEDSSYSKTNLGQILIPKHQRFTSHSKGTFHKLCGSGMHDRKLESYTLDRAELLIPKLGTNESLRNDAWEYYKDWRSNLQARTNPTLGEIYINRIGWKHITRLGRLPERIVQSWLLLGAAKKLVSESKDFLQLRNAHVTPLANDKYLGKDAVLIVDYLGLRGNVIFPHRDSSIIQVVLKRSRLICPNNKREERTKIWFYSVYELRRGIANI